MRWDILQMVAPTKKKAQVEEGRREA